MKSSPSASQDELTEQESDREFWVQLKITVFTVSAGMVGVCLTTIGLIQVIKNLSRFTTVCDTLLVLDALLFLISAISSYFALRLHFRWKWKVFMRVAELAISIGMALMVLICAILVRALA
jgi:hypothetical protein